MGKKVLVFDMDGTLADLSAVDNWLEELRSYNPKPYQVAPPRCDMELLVNILEFLRTKGWTIAITSWLSMETTPEYDELVREAKLEWLEKYKFPYDVAHIVKYGTTKANCTRKLGGYQILVDDNAKIRRGWRLGDTIDANGDIINEITKLMLDELMREG